MKRMWSQFLASAEVDEQKRESGGQNESWLPVTWQKGEGSLIYLWTKLFPLASKTFNCQTWWENMPGQQKQERRAWGGRRSPGGKVLIQELKKTDVKCIEFKNWKRSSCEAIITRPVIYERNRWWCQTFVIGHIWSRNLKSQAPVCSTLRIRIVYRVCACKQKSKGSSTIQHVHTNRVLHPQAAAWLKCCCNNCSPMDHKTANVDEVIIPVLSSQDLTELKRTKNFCPSQQKRNRNIVHRQQ